MEEWRGINGFPNYEVSNMGRVRSIDHVDNLGRSISGRILKQCYDGLHHYLHVNLCNNGTNLTRNVHRLVAETFLENPDGLPEVNHKDENKGNNAVSNLEWCDHVYNNNFGSKNGATRGELNPQSKFSKDAVAFIKKNHMACGGNLRNKELAEMFGMSPTHVCAIAHGRRWNYDSAN